jgi:hypothetical protein
MDTALLTHCPTFMAGAFVGSVSPGKTVVEKLYLLRSLKDSVVKN